MTQVQRAIFAASYDASPRRLYGPGFGWISAYLTEGIWMNDDGIVNSSAVYGAQVR